MILNLLTLVFEFSRWSVCLSIDLCPTIWMVGCGYEPAPEEAVFQTRKVMLYIPTLRIELDWFCAEDLSDDIDELSQ